jgi:hypothetical protein
MVTIRGRLMALATLAVLLLVSGLSSLSAAQTNPDVEYFEMVVNGELSAPLLAGPFDFTLEQQPGVLSVYRAGLDVADFVAHAAFTNPAVDEGVAWDYGFQFRTTGENEDLRIFIVSDGTWNFAVGTDPPEQTVTAPNLDTTPGAVNTLDLIVDGFQATFGINGEFAGVIVLPELLPSGDVYASTGFYGDLSVAGRTIGLSDFLVYQLPGTEPEAQEVAPLQPGEIPPARPVSLHVGSCSALGETVQVMTDATYPIGDFTGQSSAVVSETSFTRVPLLLEQLLAEPYAINVAQSYEAPGVSIACGDIGGILDELGGFVIALSERNGSGYNGVSYISPEDELGRTNVSVFIVPAPGGVAAPAEDLAEAPPAETPSVAEATPVTVATPITEATPVMEATPGSILIVEEAPAGTSETRSDATPMIIEVTEPTTETTATATPSG